MALRVVAFNNTNIRESHVLLQDQFDAKQSRSPKVQSR